MNDPETDYERWRRAERELGAHGDADITPIEETDEVAEAVEDETPVAKLDELGAHGDADITPIEETDEVAEAVEDETPVAKLDELAARQAEAAAAGHGGAPREEPKPDDETGPTKHMTPDELAGHGRDEGDRPA